MVLSTPVEVGEIKGVLTRASAARSYDKQLTKYAQTRLSKSTVEDMACKSVFW